jgi:endo-1,4-beta-xylanase
MTGPLPLFFLLLTLGSIAAEPEPLRTLLDMPSAEAWKPMGNKVGGTLSYQPGIQRLHITVPRRGEKSWDLCVHSPTLTQPVKKGEKLWFSFPLRNAGPAQPQPRLIAYVEHVSEKGVKFQLGGQAYADEVSVQETWTADADYPANTLRLSVHLAQEAQTLTLGPLRCLAYAPEVDAAKLPVTPLSYFGREADAPWRDAAMKRIREHRMSDVSITVKNLDGAPVKDAKIAWHQQRHRFAFGTFIEPPLLKKDADGDRYRAFVKEHFNYATLPAYLAEWGWLKEAGRQQSLRMADWLRDQGIPARGHLLVYPGYVATPNAWRDLPAAERRQRIEAHFAPVIRGLGERGVREYDVVNELRDNIGFCDELGVPTGQSGLQVVADWFQKARRLAPDAALYINEYWILGGGGYTQREQDLYFKTIGDLIGMQAPLDGIGLQGHFGSALTPPARLIEVLNRFAEHGRRLRVTEFDLDIGDEQAQADYTRDFYLALYSHAAVDGIVQWGFWEGQQWKPRAAMMRKDWTPKPSYEAFRRLTKETLASHHDAVTDAKGAWSERVHQGTHTLKISVHGYERTLSIEVPPGGKRIEVHVP